MRKALVKVHDLEAGILSELKNTTLQARSSTEPTYEFTYFDNYKGASVSLTMPTTQRTYAFDHFPPFFDGVLPEGGQLEGLLRTRKIDRTDYFTQLIAVGHDLVGAVTVREMP
jgi:serine/threonine-protein kinase HipA